MNSSQVLICPDNGIREGFHYVGFRLENDTVGNKHKAETWQKCLQLCKSLKGCRYFNFRQSQQDCSVKTGMGRKEDNPFPGEDGIYFGHRDIKIKSCQDSICEENDQTSDPDNENSYHEDNDASETRSILDNSSPTPRPSTKADENSSPETTTTQNIVIGVGVAVSFVSILAITACVLFCVKRRKGKKADHIVFSKKQKSLPEDVKELMANEIRFTEEFKNLESFVTETITPVKNVNTSTQDENILHNRYRDIGNKFQYHFIICLLSCHHN